MDDFAGALAGGGGIEGVEREKAGS